MLEQLTEFFDNLESLDVCFDLNENIIQEQKNFLELEKQKKNEEEKIKSKREMPFWEGVSFIDNKKSKYKLKENFKK